MRSLICRGLLCMLLACGITNSPRVASAEPAKEVVTISNPLHRPQADQFQPPLGTYVYSVSWQGIPAASATVQVDQEGSSLRIVASAKTASAIDLFYTLRYRAEGLISALDFLPEKTVIRQQENSRIKGTDISFLDGGEVFAVRTANNGKEPVIERFTSEGQTLDPFSATFLARSVDWKLGQSVQFPTFNGKSRYLITLTAIELSSVEVNGVERPVWVIEPKVKQLGKQKQSKLRDARIYVSADRAREVLKIVSEVFIGSVTTELESYTPLTKRTLVAKLEDKAKPALVW